MYSFNISLPATVPYGMYDCDILLWNNNNDNNKIGMFVCLCARIVKSFCVLCRKFLQYKMPVNRKTRK